MFWWVETKPLKLGSIDRYKRIQALRFGLKNTVGVTVKLYSQEDVDSPKVLFHTESINDYMNIPDYEVPFLVIRLEGLQNTEAFKLSSLRILGTEAGYVI